MNRLSVCRIRRHIRQFRPLAIVLILLCLSGCVWLRMLQVKNQLARFDDFFLVDVDEGFHLHFQQPVLFGKDLIYLAKMEPSRETALADGAHWSFIFIKEPVEGYDAPIARDFTFDVYINDEDRLQTFSFAPEFLEITPADFLENSIRALATANINRRLRHLHADTESLAQVKLTPPTREHILHILGTPHEADEEDETWQLTYLYKLLPSSGDLEQSEAKATMEMTFDKTNDRLTRLRGRFAGLRVSVNYKKIVEAYEQAQAAAQ